MTNQILNDVAELIELSDDELTEALLDEKYNKALLRELVRRSLKLAKLYWENYEYEKRYAGELDERIKKFTLRQL